MPRQALAAFRLGLAATCTALLLYAGATHAFDPRNVDILNLRLGMREKQVLDQLDTQGYVDASLIRQRAPCGGQAGSSCLNGITARTKDGTLTLTFAGPRPGEEQVVRIDYVFGARRPGEPESIEQSVMNRFGQPTARQPMAWCDRVAGSGPCPDDQPRLSFQFKPEVLLSLIDGSPASR